VQLHVHLKKWTLKFKPLYLRNYASYFNKIHRISCVNTRIKSLKVWLKSILLWLKYSIFLGDCFLLAHPVHHWDVSNTCQTKTSLLLLFVRHNPVWWWHLARWILLNIIVTEKVNPDNIDIAFGILLFYATLGFWHMIPNNHLT